MGDSSGMILRRVEGQLGGFAEILKIGGGRPSASELPIRDSDHSARVTNRHQDEFAQPPIIENPR